MVLSVTEGVSPSTVFQNVPTPLPVNIVRATHGQLIAFLVLNVWPSHFGLPLLLAIVVFSKRIHRHITFINLCVAFIIVGISSSLLLYIGKIEGPEPPRMVCLLQASLLYGMPGLTSMAALMLVLQMFLVIRSHYNGQEYLDRDHVFRLWAITVAPYIAFFIPILATAAIGASHPERLSRSRRVFYCSVDFLPLTNTLTIASALVLFATLVFEVWTVVILFKQWNIQKSNTSLSKPLDLSLPARIMAFGFYIIIAMSLSLLSVKSPQSPIPDLMIATAASMVVLIFGTQKDILRTICFWRERKSKRVQPLDATFSTVDLKDEFPTSERETNNRLG